ncbi:hypothetical protein [Krasilnikovia sp. M28-CT-15]|uniref:hypothetical protein n=1 Tax=Krasilnikovia sp. M28-CT-15 TaxID=3373540 RepID=UPI00399C9803
MSLDLTDATADALAPQQTADATAGDALASQHTADAAPNDIARRYAAVVAERDAVTAVAHAVADIPRVPARQYATGDAEAPAKRPPARHRRRLGLQDLPALAERSWRPPLVLAVVLFVACGPAQAFGYADVVYFAVLIGLALSGIAVPLGLLALRESAPGDADARDQAQRSA